MRLSVHETTSNGTFIVISTLQAGEPAAQAAEAYTRIGEVLRAAHLEIVHERIFASVSAIDAVKRGRREALATQGIAANGPITSIQGQPTWGDGFAGVIVRAVACESVRIIQQADTPVGRCWQQGEVKCVVLQNLQGLSCSSVSDKTPAMQTTRAIQLAERTLRDYGLSYRDVARTWFYLADILDWYAEFNQARSAVYRDLHLADRDLEGQPRFPASTGIRGHSPTGAVCTLDLLAIRGAANVEPFELLRNPHQKEAYRYGSAFSRGAIIRGERESLIEISGTAAINERGDSIYLDDIRGQVRCTLEKMAGVLAQAGASLSDVRAATVFVKNAGDVPAARAVMAEQGLGDFPAVWVQADVCRDELLFEIDAEAVTSG